MSEPQRAFAADSVEAQARCLERRNRVLARPHLAAKLTQAPMSLPDPKLWSGYIPPAMHQEQPNLSPVRNQLIAICNMVKAEEEAEAQAAHPPDVAPPLVNEKGLQLLHICFDRAGIVLREEKLMYCQGVIGHAVESTKELTAAEAYECRRQLSQIVVQEEAHDDPQTELVVEQQPRPDPAAHHPDADGPSYTTGYVGNDEGWDSWQGITERGDEPPY